MTGKNRNRQHRTVFILNKTLADILSACFASGYKPREGVGVGMGCVCVGGGGVGGGDRGGRVC